MWKIEIKDNNRTVKRKIYESEKTFTKWLKSHKNQYGSVYSIIPFEYKDGNWEKL